MAITPDRVSTARIPDGTPDESPAYQDGWSDGMQGLDPNPDRLAYGANKLNDYERGYIDSGQAKR